MPTQHHMSDERCGCPQNRLPSKDSSLFLAWFAITFGDCGPRASRSYPFARQAEKLELHVKFLSCITLAQNAMKCVSVAVCIHFSTSASYPPFPWSKEYKPCGVLTRFTRKVVSHGCILMLLKTFHVFPFVHKICFLEYELKKTFLAESRTYQSLLGQWYSLYSKGPHDTAVMPLDLGSRH